VVQNRINQIIELDENKRKAYIKATEIKKGLKGHLINQQDKGISESGI
jgi:hypothetical protein